MATKKRPATTKRGKIIQVRLTATELAHVDHCAKVRNVTRSEYARLALIMGRLT
jgi:hypothetical protein